jgi:hypothetical protein
VTRPGGHLNVSTKRRAARASCTMCRWKALPWLNADESEEWLSRIHRLVRICTQSKHINAIKSLWSDVPDKVKVETLNVLSDIFQSRPTPPYMYTANEGLSHSLPLRGGAHEGAGTVPLLTGHGRQLRVSMRYSARRHPHQVRQNRSCGIEQLPRFARGALAHVANEAIHAPGAATLEGDVEKHEAEKDGRIAAIHRGEEGARQVFDKVRCCHVP